MRLAVDADTLLSGLFFDGKERRLLLASLRGSVRLVVAEDTLEEVYDVVAKVFSNHRDLPSALDLLEEILDAGEVVRRRLYARNVASWAKRLRDPTDAPLLACAVAVGVDGVVSGDKDVIESQDLGGIRAYRTREVLERLGEHDREKKSVHRPTTQKKP
jgi:predicted nucleic acid-binding protein